MAKESAGSAALQMAMGHVSALSNQFDVLDNKAALIMGANLVLCSLAFSITTAASITLWSMVAPAIVVLAGTVLGMLAVRPRTVLQFIDPATLIANYRDKGYGDDAIAWALIESVKESVDSYERAIARKASFVRCLQLSLVLFVLSVLVSVAVAVAVA